jgi:ribonuclease R
MRYALGSRVRVQVSRVDLDGRKIDFRLVREGEVVRVGAPGGPGGYVRLDADEEATGRPMKKSVKASRATKPAATKTGQPRTSRAERSERGLSPIQALKAAVKKAAKKKAKRARR